MSKKLKGSQVDIFALGGSMDRDSTEQYLLRLAVSGGLEVVTNGLQVKSNGILSSMIAAGAILGPHVGFNSNDIPDASTFGGPKIKDSLNTAYNDITARLRRDGTAPMTGNLNMGGNRITAMADGTGITDAVTLQQMQNYVALGMRWLYPCAYAGVGVVPPAYGCLLAGGKVRASQSIKMTAVPANNNTITFDGALITFSTTAGPNKCVIVGGDIPSTVNNLVNAINSCTSPVTSLGVALNTVAYAIREETAGTVVHIVWRGHDGTPTTANGLPCATTAVGITFANTDPATSGGRFYGAYNSSQDGGTIQGRRDNGVYMYDADAGNWTLIFANPGSNFFTTASGDAGAGQVNAGLNGNLFIAGGTGINTVSAVSVTPPGAKITINHGDLGVNTSQFHSEESIKLNTPYYQLGTGTSSHQNDFNAAVDAGIGDARDTALRNVLVNGSFIADPSDPSFAGHSFTGGTGTALACMPGWAIRDDGTGGNLATVTLKTSGGGGTVTPRIGTYLAEVDVTALSGSVKVVYFYQRIIGGEQYKGQKVTFRASVYAPANTTPRLFVQDSTMASPAVGPAHTTTAGWEDLYVNTTIGSTATWIRVGMATNPASPTQTGTYCIDACSCVFGAQYTNMAFMPRPELEDIQLVHSLYQKIYWSQHVWNAGSPGGEVTLTFGTSMFYTPTAGDITINVTTDPPTDTVAALDAASLSEHGCHFNLSSVINYAANNVVKGNLIVDMRPT